MLKNGSIKLTAIGAALLTAAMTAPAAAGAAPSRVSLVIDQGNPNDMPPHGVLQLDAGGKHPTPREITATSIEDEAYLLRDTGGIELAPLLPGTEHGEQCTQLNPYVVRCGPTVAEPMGALDIRGGPGPDRVDLRVTQTSIRKYVDGRGGPDRILGSGGEEIALGGSGNDVLIGYLGRDVLDGGGGADTIRSRDGLRDMISCGRGDGRREKAIRDRFDRKITTVWGGAWADSQPISC